MAANIIMRFAPGAAGTGPQKTTFVTGANAAVQLRAAAGSTRNYSVKVVTANASCNIATGDGNIAAPTANDPLLEATDGWVDFTLPAGATHIRLFGGATGGSLYIWDWGS
jgi:hypothetical protein